MLRLDLTGHLDGFALVFTDGADLFEVVAVFTTFDAAATAYRAALAVSL